METNTHHSAMSQGGIGCGDDVDEIREEWLQSSRYELNDIPWMNPCLHWEGINERYYQSLLLNIDNRTMLSNWSEKYDIIQSIMSERRISRSDISWYK